MSPATKHSTIRALRASSEPLGTGAVLSKWARAVAFAGLCLSWAPVSGQQARREQPLPRGEPQGNPGERPFQPNIILIVLDDVGTDKLAMYGESDSASYATRPYCGQLDGPLPYPRTPNLTALADGQVPGLTGGGIRFERAYSAPICCTARASLMTGRYGVQNGLGVVDDGGQLRKRMSNTEVFVPELLRFGFPVPTSSASLRRYKSGAFGKWHLTALPVCDPVMASDFAHPILNSFNIFQGTIGNVGVNGSNPGDHYNWTKVTSVPGSTELTRYAVGSEPLIAPFQFSSACTAPGTLLQTTNYSEETYSASITRADAVTWINGQSQPFFAYVNFNPPHFPNQVPPLTLLSSETAAELQDSGNPGGPYCPGQLAGTTSTCGTSTCTSPTSMTAKQKRIFYNAALEAVDTEIGNLLAQIHPLKLASTMVFVIGDNGTPEAAVEPMLHDPTHAKGELFELSVRVPMIVAGSLVPSGGHETDALIHAVDLWSTFAEISGADPVLAAPKAPLASVAFADLIRDPSFPTARSEVFCQTFVQPGEYYATEAGPYELGCADPTVPGAYACVPRNVGQHGRSLSDGQYKLIVTQSTPGEEVAPEGMPDVAPIYVEELYDILADPAEVNDLAPLVAGDPTLGSIRDQLRGRMTQLSGF